MVKIDALILGYRKLRITPPDLSLTTEILLRAAIPSSINNDGSITVRERDFKKTCELFSGRVDFSYSKPMGVLGFVRRIKNKYAIVIGIVISILIVALLSGIVWDVRVEGNEKITESEIILGLEDLGFGIGEIWRNKNLSEIEASFLQSNDSVSWININRRGTVAYVKIIEKEEGNDEIKPQYHGFSNIVSSADCVIEEITVKRGVALVKPGDVVKKGDLLVAGILPAESGGGFCHADAIVIGRLSDSVSVEIDRNSEEKYKSDKKLYSYTINFFNFSINIFKLYGNLTKECAIIEDEITYSLFGRCKLPIFVTKTYMIEENTRTVSYSDEELVKIALSRLRSLTVSRLLGSDLLRIKTEGKFTEGGYFISSDIVFLSQVGEERAFQVE